ncbi:hypothetical protein JW848_08685 [Candidatus Bipolaricaulota bacterium]|nr:hypothetical protein [Candidatus Bipolaricaulota bacterium]
MLRMAAVSLIAADADASAAYAEIPGAEPITDIDAFLAQCPPQDELEILQRDFAVLYEPGPQPEPGRGGSSAAYRCGGSITTATPLSDASAIYQALHVIRHMKLSEPLPWTDLHPYEWLKSKIGAIVVSSTMESDHCCKSVDVSWKSGRTLAVTIRSASGDPLDWRRSWINRQSGVGLEGLVLLMFHEARHVDVPHTWGSGDATLSETGAWGVQFTIAQWIADGRIAIGTNVSSHYQAADGWAALERIQDPDD